MRVRPRPSRALFLWWGAVHALAAAGILASALPAPLAVLVLTGLLAHSRWRRPRPAVPVDLRASGRWAVHGVRSMGLTLDEGTAVGPFWIKLVLADPAGARERSGPGPAGAKGAASRCARRRRCRVVCLLLRDQLDAETWRSLQAELRRGARAAAPIDDDSPDETP